MLSSFSKLLRTTAGGDLRLVIELAYQINAPDPKRQPTFVLDIESSSGQRLLPPRNPSSYCIATLSHSPAFLLDAFKFLQETASLCRAGFCHRGRLIETASMYFWDEYVLQMNEAEYTKDLERIWELFRQATPVAKLLMMSLSEMSELQQHSASLIWDFVPGFTAVYYELLREAVCSGLVSHRRQLAYRVFLEQFNEVDYFAGPVCSCCYRRICTSDLLEAIPEHIWRVPVNDAEIYQVGGCTGVDGWVRKEILYESIHHTSFLLASSIIFRHTIFGTQFSIITTSAGDHKESRPLGTSQKGGNVPADVPADVPTNKAGNVPTDKQGVEKERSYGACPAIAPADADPTTNSRLGVLTEARILARKFKISLRQELAAHGAAARADCENAEVRPGGGGVHRGCMSPARKNGCSGNSPLWTQRGAPPQDEDLHVVLHKLKEEAEIKPRMDRYWLALLTAAITQFTKHEADEPISSATARGVHAVLDAQKNRPRTGELELASARGRGGPAKLLPVESCWCSDMEQGQRGNTAHQFWVEVWRVVVDLKINVPAHRALQGLSPLLAAWTRLCLHAAANDLFLPPHFQSLFANIYQHMLRVTLQTFQPPLKARIHALLAKYAGNDFSATTTTTTLQNTS